MEQEFIEGDLLVVDRSVTPSHGSVVVAVIDGGLTVKRLSKRWRELLHCCLNQVMQITARTAPIEIGPDTDATNLGSRDMVRSIRLQMQCMP